MYRLEIQPVRYGVAAAKQVVRKNATSAKGKINQILLTPEELVSKTKKPAQKVEKRVSNYGDYGDTCGASYGDWLVTGISC